MQHKAIVQLKQDLRGRLIQRADFDYDEVRKLYNGMIDKQPLVIARCADIADAVATVNFGRENDLRVAIRGVALLCTPADAGRRTSSADCRRRSRRTGREPSDRRTGTAR